MEFNILIRSIYESNDDETKYELIEDMKKQIESHQSVIMPELRRLFMLLSSTLQNATLDKLILIIHQTINTLIRVLLVSEIEINFKYLLQPLIQNLAESSQEIRRSTKLVIDNFLKKTRNLELIIDYLIQYGFSSENYFLREKSIGGSIRFLDICQNIFGSRSGLNDVRRLFENIIIRLGDSVENVRLKAQKVLYKILKQRNYEGFLQVQRRLSKEHQELMYATVNKKLLEQEDLKLKELYEKFGDINLDLFEDYSVDFMIENTEEMPQFSEKQILSFFPLGLNGLYFNLIREDTLIDCFNETDLRVKIQASKEVLEAYEAGETPEESIKDIKAYIGPFFKFISYLLSSKNLIVSGNAMKIVQSLVQHSAGVQMKAFLILALPPLVGKLGEERVHIRDTAFFIIRQMITTIKKHTLLKSFCLFLNDQFLNKTNPNWHIKEELLNLISILFLFLFEGKEDWYENAFLKELEGQDFNNIRHIDLKHVLTTVASFLDDGIMKVRKAAMEALAVISSHGTHKEFILQLLHEMLDSKVYDDLVDKVQIGKVYFINQHGKLEMPVIDIRRYQNEKDLYEERLKRYKMMLNEKLSDDESQRSLSQILEISQKGNDEDEDGLEFKRRYESEKEMERRQKKIKITYYNLDEEENRLMSMKDRIKRTNDNIDKYLHNHEHDGVDSVKYDILVPIKDIPMTNAQYNQNKSPNKINKSFQPNLNQNQSQNQEYQEGDSQLVDPFSGDQFGKIIFDNEEEQKRQIKREQESRYPDELQKSVYYFQPLQPQQKIIEESEKNSFDDLKIVEFEYRTDDYDPLALGSKKKPQSQKLDVQSRINSSLSKLNQGSNAKEKFTMNIPKVIQYNEREYEGYEYSVDESLIENSAAFK